MRLGILFLVLSGSCCLGAAPAAAESVTERNEKLVQAAARYNEPEVRALLAQGQSSAVKQLLSARELAKEQSNAVATRNLNELWLQEEKNWFQKHYRFSTVVIPILGGLAMAFGVCYRRGHFHNPDGSLKWGHW